MADISDVEASIVQVIGGVVYPSGTASPSAIGAPCAIERGWPNQVALAAALAAGNVVVTVYTQANIERVTTRMRADWQQVSAPATTLTTSLNGATVTIGGAVSSAVQVVTIQIGNAVYTHTASLLDTPSIIAAAFAAAIPGARSIGGDIILNLSAIAPQALSMNQPGIIAGVSGVGSICREVRRQERGIQVIVWAPTPALRDATARAIDSGLAAVTVIAMPDGLGANIKYERTVSTDANENANLYRRDLFYLVEYATTQTLPGYAIEAIQIGTPTGPVAV